VGVGWAYPDLHDFFHCRQRKTQMKITQIALALGLALGATAAFAAPQMAPATPAAPAAAATTTTTTTTTKTVHHRHHRKAHHHHHMAKKMSDHDADDMKKMDTTPAPTPPKP